MFQQLIQIVPGLDDHIMEGSNKELSHIAELVCKIYYGCIHSLIISTHLDTEGGFQCKVRQHKEHKGGCSQFDHSMWPTAQLSISL
jgi:hypothetical protein